jgi:hypothetical protein
MFESFLSGISYRAGVPFIAAPSTSPPKRETPSATGGVFFGARLGLCDWPISAVPDGSRLPTHPLKEGSCEILPLPREALLVRLEVCNALSDLVAL